MALQLSKEQTTGQTGEYWNIYAYAMYKSGALEFTVALYKDQAARTAGKEPMTLRSYTIDVPTEVDQKLVGNSLLKLLYEYLKTLPEFTGAVDIDPDV